MNRRSVVVHSLVVGTGLAALAGSFFHSQALEAQFLREARLARAEAQRIAEEVVLFRHQRVPPGLTFTDFLEQLGLGRLMALQMVMQARPAYDLRLVRAGNLLAVGRSVHGELRALRYQVDADRELWITPRGPAYHAEVKPIPSTSEVAGVSGEIRDSLFNAVTRAGATPELALELADIFGWDLDFYTDPRPGDTFRVVVEKKTYRSATEPRYTRIYAAEYVNEGQTHQAVLFRDPAGKPAYYSPDGKSLKKAFLRSPLKFSAPITSHFSHSRMHPILKRHRPHLGIDYGAPVGAPVQAIGDGRVVFAGANGQSGKMVHVQHANGYETFYLHLSRIFVQAGQWISQGERIGLVGSTGLATGPHLDFRIRQHGAYRNFERLRLPPALPVAKADWDDFLAARDRWLAQLPAAPDQAGKSADARSGGGM